MTSRKINSVLLIGVIGISLGLIFVICGAIISGIAYTEITPPNYDDNYDRYIGSSVSRLLGPFLLVFGFVLVICSGALMAMEGMKYEEVPQKPYKHPYRET